MPTVEREFDENFISNEEFDAETDRILAEDSDGEEEVID